MLIDSWAISTFRFIFLFCTIFCCPKGNTSVNSWFAQSFRYFFPKLPSKLLPTVNSFLVSSDSVISVLPFWRSFLQSIWLPLIWTVWALGVLHSSYTPGTLGFLSHFSYSPPFVGNLISWTPFFKTYWECRGDKTWRLLYSETIFYSDASLISQFWLDSNFKVGNTFLGILKALLLSLLFLSRNVVLILCSLYESRLFRLWKLLITLLCPWYILSLMVTHLSMYFLTLCFTLGSPFRLDIALLFLGEFLN